EFVKCVTQIHGFTKYDDVASVKEDFDQIVKDYSKCVKELNPNYSKILSPVGQEYLKDDEIEDVIKDKKLNHGWIIFDRGMKSIYKFEHQFKINFNPINRNTGIFNINLMPIKTPMDTLLKYNIKPSAITSEHFQLISGQLVNDSANKVYLEIQYPLLELVFEKENIKLPEILIEDINNALKDNDPYHKLMQIFDDYGHFVPRKVILGHKLYRMSHLKRNKTLLEKKKIVTREYFETSEFNEFWNEWNNSIMHYCFDEVHLSSMSSEKFDRNEITKWASFLSDNNLQVICWDELHSLYELLDNNLKQKVKSIFGINDQTGNISVKKEKILMTGVIPITNSPYYLVNLPDNLSSDNYQIFGRLVTQDGKLIDAVIKFKAMTAHNFLVLIDIDKTMDISIIASGSHKFAYAKKFDIDIPFLLPENLPTNWIFCASFQYLKDCGPNFHAAIQYDKVNNKFIITIYDDSNMYDTSTEEYLLNWCIFPKDHKILVDNLKSREILGGKNQEISADNHLEKRFNL
ncbi:12503_t:CDS:2, partial [Racocetra fulgida]